MNTKLEWNFCSRVPLTARPSGSIPFGSWLTPHMVRLSINQEGILGKPELMPYGPESFSPALLTLHYGQSIFEGLKAFRHPDGEWRIFRANDHAHRFGNSAEIMGMPRIPPEVFTECCEQLVAWEASALPNDPDLSLYLRPLLIARDEVIKLRPSHIYTFYVLGAIVGDYFAGQGRGAKVYVDPRCVRAAPGGLGEAKTAANYAASLGPQRRALEQGCDQVLYLDALTHTKVDELGGMNFFYLRGRDLVTPRLNGCILPGVTRKTLLQMAPQLGLHPVEEVVAFDDVLQGLSDGRIQACFASGTAATVLPIDSFTIQGPHECHTVTGTHDVSLVHKLRSSLQDYQFGRKSL